MTDTPSDNTAPAPDKTPAPFSPFANLVIPEQDAPQLPPEPPIGSVVGWLERGGTPSAAVRSSAHSGWYLDGHEDGLEWADLCEWWDKRGVAVGAVGVATAWRPLSEQP